MGTTSASSSCERLGAVLRRALGIALVGLVGGGCFADPAPVADATDGAETGGDVDSTSDDESAVTDTGLAASDDDTGAPTDGETADPDDTGAPSCPADCPTGHCDATGACARYIFVTQIGYSSDMGGLPAANEACQAEADAAGLDPETTFNALLADDVVSGWSNAEIDELPGAAFIRLDDVVAARNPEQLRAAEAGSALEVAIDVGADGVPVEPDATACIGAADATDRVWTGFARPGGLPGPAGTCANWGDDETTLVGGTGRFATFESDWLGATNCPCGGTIGDPTRAHLYCVELP